MKSPKSKRTKKQPVRTIREQVLAAILSEAGRQAVKLIGTVAITVIMQHIGAPDISPQLLLV